MAFEDLKGKILSKITKTTNDDDNDELIFELSSGVKYFMGHIQD